MTEGRSEQMYKKFEKLLVERNVTAYRVSKDTGISTATLTEWKNGTYKPKVEKLALIAKYFDVPIEYFLDSTIVR